MVVYVTITATNIQTQRITFQISIHLSRGSWYSIQLILLMAEIPNNHLGWCWNPINPPTPRCGKCGGGVWEGAKPRVWYAGEVQTDFNERSAELQTGFNESFGPFVVCWLLVCFLRPMWVVQWPLSDHVGRNSSCLACWWVVNWFQWQMCCLGVRRFSMTGVLPWRSEVSMSGRLCAEVSSSICFQPSVRELFVPILWLPRRCVFDGFLQEF